MQLITCPSLPHSGRETEKKVAKTALAHTIKYLCSNSYIKITYPEHNLHKINKVLMEANDFAGAQVYSL